MQSHLNSIDILPALPVSIPEGRVRGVRARGGFELDFEWKEGKLTTLKVLSVAGYPLSLRYGENTFRQPTRKGEVLLFNQELKKIIPLKKPSRNN